MRVGTIITPERTHMAVRLGFDANIPEDWPAPSVLDKLIECGQRAGEVVLRRVIKNLMFPYGEDGKGKRIDL
jgi:hypothetical protein